MKAREEKAETRARYLADRVRVLEAINETQRWTIEQWEKIHKKHKIPVPTGVVPTAAGGVENGSQPTEKPTTTSTKTTATS